MIIKDGRVDYSRPAMGDTVARLTLTLDIAEDNPGAAILWAHQVIDQWSAPLLLDKEAAAAPPANPTTNAIDYTEVHLTVDAAGRITAASKENPTTATDAASPPQSADAQEQAAPSAASTSAKTTASKGSNPFAITAPVVPAANPTTTASIPPAATPPSAEKSDVSTDATVASAPQSVKSVGPVSSPSDVPELTDNDLHAAAQMAVERKVPATRVKAITAKYASGSMSMRDIPADKRPLWLKEVKGLTR